MNTGTGDFCYRPQNRWLRRKTDRNRYGQLLRYLGFGLIPLAVFTVAAWSNLEAVRRGYRVEKLRTEKEELEKEIRDQQLELGRLTDPLRVGKAAAEMHGLVVPEAVAVLDLSRGRVIPPAAGTEDEEE